MLSAGLASQAVCYGLPAVKQGSASETNYDPHLTRWTDHLAVSREYAGPTLQSASVLYELESIGENIAYRLEASNGEHLTSPQALPLLYIAPTQTLKALKNWVSLCSSRIAAGSFQTQPGAPLLISGLTKVVLPFQAFFRKQESILEASQVSFLVADSNCSRPQELFVDSDDPL